MLEPVDDLEQVVQIEDIMPYVFWWDNRGNHNNGPDAECYGLQGDSKLNYDKGWCHSSAHKRKIVDETIDSEGTTTSIERLGDEQRWHAVAHTLGVDFADEENGGALLTMDNSGNVYKGAFDPHCCGTDEKWKIHHPSNEFGAYQDEDPTADKYYQGDKTHGDGEFKSIVPSKMNEDILKSIEGRPMTWNLWNAVRHYAYIKYFKNQNRTLGTDESSWVELERYTKRIVRGIYRTFKEKQRPVGSTARNSFQAIDAISTNHGGVCNIPWTNSFIEVASILDRNAREHQASFVLTTGDVPKPAGDMDLDKEEQVYNDLLGSLNSFRVLTLAGMDADDSQDGINHGSDKTFKGSVYGDLPTTYVLGDDNTFPQTLPETQVVLQTPGNLDQMYPYAEYHLNDVVNKWVRNIHRQIINRQMLPVYTSMEGMNKDYHLLTEKEMKSITFNVVPSLYWKYEWSTNDVMIHRVGKLQAPNPDLTMYDMLGNVWELVRDKWANKVADLDGKVNPIAEPNGASDVVIKGGAFNEFCRKVISPARQGIATNTSKSSGSAKDNVGFRPAMTFTQYDESTSTSGGPGGNTEKVDLFFLFDASASQDNQIQDMLDSAKMIVAKYAGDADNKDVCHVTTALFLGPTIKFMCAN